MAQSPGARLDESARGVYLIAVTPFRDDGALDLESTDRMVDFYLERGATGLTVLGIMGEAPKLEPEESLAVTARFIAGFGQLPVIVGVSAPGLAAMRRHHLAHHDPRLMMQANMNFTLPLADWLAGTRQP